MADVNKLPGWTYYVIAGLSSLVLILLGISGTLLVQDRKSIASAFEKVEFMQGKQNENIANQNIILKQICILLPLDHKTRSEHLKNYPFIWLDKAR
jgi:hypothetical protein